MARTIWLLIVAVAVCGCASLPGRDPLRVDVANVESLPSEGLEIRLAVQIRIQNPNDAQIEFSGAALDLDLNGQRLASGVSDQVGVVPRYGETVVTIPVTISAFNVARQVMGFIGRDEPGAMNVEVSGKLEAGPFGTRRFRDTASFELPVRARTPL